MFWTESLKIQATNFQAIFLVPIPQYLASYQLFGEALKNELSPKLKHTTSTHLSIMGY